MKIRRLLLFLFDHRFLAIARWQLHFLRIRLRNTMTGQDRRIRTRLSSSTRPVFLNLGSGPRGLDDGRWINVDGFPDRNVHFLLDISRRLPIDDSTFDGVFCEHVLEHFSLEEGRALAREVHRILRPGGRFRIVVPDAELLIRRYLDSPSELVEHRGEGDETPMAVVNTYFRQRYEHQFMYDWPTMERMVSSAGFGSAERASFGKGSCRDLVLDDPKYEWESLYVDVLKAQSDPAKGKGA